MSDARLPKDIHDTLEASRAIRDRNANGPVTAEHFHSYEYLVSLLARRQDESNKLLEGLTRELNRLTKDIKILTCLLYAIAIYEIVKAIL